MIRDRGTIKWTAMMLPEHVKLLREWKQEAYAEGPHTLTDWELEDLQQTIEQAYTQQIVVTITMWQETKFVQWTGTIKALNHETQQLLLETLTTTKHIPFSTIYAALLEDI